MQLQASSVQRPVRLAQSRRARPLKTGRGVTADPRQVAYQEIQGGFDPASAEPKTRDEVHLSNIVRLHVQGRSCDGLWVRYVARGQENYRVDGRAYSVKAGQLFISTQSH